MALNQHVSLSSNSTITIDSLFKNELLGFALVDTSGSIRQMNMLFSKISSINASSDQNLFNYTLFSQPEFVNEFQALKTENASEFSLNLAIKTCYKNQMYVQIKAFRLDTNNKSEQILIILEDSLPQLGVEQVIQQIGNSLNQFNTDNFFKTVCLSLADSLATNMVFIGEYNSIEKTINSVSFLADQRFVPPLSYLIENTPAEMVFKENKLIYFESNVQFVFPKDLSLKHWKAMSYIGCSLRDSKGNIVGYISLMDQKEIKNASLIKSVLKLYSHSLGREIERKRQEQQILSGEKRYKTIYDQSPFGIVSSNAEGNLIANNKFCDMLGYSSEELSKLTKYDITHEEDKKAHLTLTRTKQNSFQFNKRYIKKDGSISYCKVTTPDFEGELDDLKNSFVIIEDISGQIEVDKKLKEHQNQLKINLKKLNAKNEVLQKYIDSNMQLENFAHIASHDLREPLRSIGNFSHILHKQLAGRLDESEQEFFGFIMTGVKNMNQLIEDLLVYSTVNAQSLPLKDLDLNQILFMVNRNLDKAILDHKAELLVHELPISFKSCSTKMKQLFQNLIANGLKFRKPDVAPKIEVHCKDDGDFWKFSVRDNGIGIKDEFKDKIFMIFKKLHSKAEYQGTGIGLAVCKKIVTQHGGKIWIESELGGGTTFFFTMLKE